MEPFCIDIAGLSVCVYPMFQSTREYCRPYLTDNNPEFTVTVSAEDLILEQALLEREAIEQGLKIRKFKDPFLERSIIQRRIADRLISDHTLMIHGSTVAVDGFAYLFSAPCRTGKSTHTRLWRELFGDRAIMVNDDSPFVRITSSGVYAYGSPWSGKHGLASNICVPLKGICFLHRGMDNVISRVNSEKGIDLLRFHVHMPEDTILGEKAELLIETLSNRVPLWEMYCNKEKEAAMLSYSSMSRDL